MANNPSNNESCLCKHVGNAHKHWSFYRNFMISRATFPLKSTYRMNATGWGGGGDISIRGVEGGGEARSVI